MSIKMKKDGLWFRDPDSGELRSVGALISGGEGGTVDSVNGKTGVVVLTAEDVGARADDWTPSASDVGAVPTTRTVNGKALSADITLSASDVSALPDSTVIPADMTSRVEAIEAQESTWSGKQDSISDLDTIRSGASAGATAVQPGTMETALSGKQDSIGDLADIRSGAAKGATALQSYTETDPTVPDWAKADSKPSYTADDVGARPDTWMPSASDVGADASGTAATLINRTTAVDAADTNYETYMARGESLNSADTTPTVNGTIAWTYS